MTTIQSVRFFSATLLLSVLLFSTSTQAQTAASVLEKTHTAIAKAQTLKYRSVMSERLKNGKEYKSETRIKLQAEPLRIYFLNIYPKNGVEVIYDTQVSTQKALINPNGFPWMSIKLSIHSDHMRDGKHHSINHAGMRYFDKAIRAAENQTKASGRFDEVFTYAGTTILNGVNCHKIVIDDKNFAILDYTVLKGENLVSIANKLVISEYKILELNPEVKGFFEVEEGQKLKIPSSYGKTIVLYIHAENFIPAGIEISDEKGLFEKYNFFEIEVNPSINPVEFTEDFSEYGF